MFGQTFYHKTIRKYVTYFGTLFNEIYITRDTTGTASDNSIRVPITYGPTQKTLARLDADPDLNRPAAIVLPRLSFELNGLSYSGARKLTTINKGHIKIDATRDERLKYVYNPVPYDLNFSLYVMVKNAEDGTKILEQILPYFTPEWTSTLNLIPELEVKMDIPVVINNVSVQDTYEGPVESDRLIIWTLDFTMLGYLFGPVKKTGIITLANINFYATDPSNTVDERVTIRPGMLANGSPTTNASLSVARDEINANDNWTYITRIESIDEQ